MFEQLLSLSDYDVTTAASAREALELAQSQGFDLFVLDRRLPDGMGADLCRELKQFRPEVPVILYSGDVYEIHRQEGITAGADAYVPKPHFDKLIQAVHQMLSEQACAVA